MDAVEEIKQRLAIEDVIGEYVQLKRAGRNFKGLSPFNAEKTPSFIVSPEKQIWHDFSSGKGGNVFSFIMELEGLDFKGALEHLARKANVDLEQFKGSRPGSNAKLKDRLHDAIEHAAKFYQVQFSRNQTALEYVFKKRKFNKTAALEFRLGYAPNTGTALVNYLRKKGFTDKELSQAGLTARRYQSLSDMFRGRLMVPLMDPQHRVIGFTARLLEDIPDAPKYINTPQTILYDKSRHVFGLNFAKDAIRKSAYAVMAEGNLDVIASHQAGVRQVVATAGTALTPWQLKAIGRFAPEVRLAFDQDRAGQAATERAIPIAAQVGINLQVVSIPSGKDPDDLIKQDPKAWERVIAKPEIALDWLIERYKSQLDLSSAPGKRQFSDIVLNVIRTLPDQVEQDHYITKVAALLSISPDAVRSKLRTGKVTAPRLKRAVQAYEPPSEEMQEYVKLQDHLLALNLFKPLLRPSLEPVTPDMLRGEPAQKVLEFLKTNPEFDGKIGAAAPLSKVSEYCTILQLQYETLYQHLELVELKYEVARLQARLIEHYVKQQKYRLAKALGEADDRTTKQLLREVKALDQLLNTR